MTQTIRIDIREYDDFTHPYFLGTSPDVPELLVQGNSVDEVLELAPSVVTMILEEKQKIAEKEAQKTSPKATLFSLKNKDILVQYTYNKRVSLHPA